jgi:hypothetical protein
VEKTLLPVPQADDRSKEDRFGKTNIMLVLSIVGFAFSAVALVAAIAALVHVQVQ